MRDINYNYTWFTGCDSRGLVPPTLASSPLLVHHHTHALLKLPPFSGWYRCLFPQTPGDPLHSELNKHVRTKARCVHCCIKGDVKSPVCNTSAVSRCINAPRWLHQQCLRALCISNPPSVKRLDCATKFVHHETLTCSRSPQSRIVRASPNTSTTYTICFLPYIQRANILERVRNKRTNTKKYLEFWNVTECNQRFSRDKIFSKNNFI